MMEGERKANFIKRVILATLGIRNELTVIVPHAQSSLTGYLNCWTCCGVFVEPVYFPCGHSLCKSCAERLAASSSTRNIVSCPACSKEHSLFVDRQGTLRCSVTLVLSNILLQWFPHKIAVHRLKEEGNKLAEEGKNELAIQKYTEAIQIAKVDDHRVLSNRSKAFVAVGNFSEALKDAERCCTLRPYWAKGHYRRAVVLEKLGRLTEALSAYILCMRFGGNECVIQKATAALFMQLLEQKLFSGNGNNCGNNNNGRTTSVSMDDDDANILVARNSSFQELKELILKLSLQSHKAYTSEMYDDLNCCDYKINEADMECMLCKGLLFEPVTASCGHSFCRECLYRVLDHAQLCPVCRATLIEASRSYDSDLAIDAALEGILEHHYKPQNDKRNLQHQQAILEAQKIGLSTEVELPVFVCTHVYPSVTSIFHIFEPRYRMLIRNCMTGSRRFGMCAQTKDGKACNYGTVLYIESVQYTPDGRSVIKTKGERRFEIQSLRMNDGLHVAKVEFIADKLVENESVKQLESEVYRLAKNWFTALSNATKLHIIDIVGSEILTTNPSSPSSQTDGPLWLWLFIHIFPTSNKQKTNYLKSTDLSERLKMLQAAIPIPT